MGKQITMRSCKEENNREVSVAPRARESEELDLGSLGPLCPQKAGLEDWPAQVCQGGSQKPRNRCSSLGVRGKGHSEFHG